MKIIPQKFAFLTFIICILLSNCDKGIVQEEQTIEQANTVAIVDPFYADLDENSSLEEYWELFVADAIRSGKPDPGSDRNINIFFGSEPDFASGVTSDHAGRAYDVCNQETVSFEYVDENFEKHSKTLTGLAARVFQHEYDHLEGILFTDKLSSLKKRILKKKLEKISLGKISSSYRMRFPNIKI